MPPASILQQQRVQPRGPAPSYGVSGLLTVVIDLTIAKDGSVTAGRLVDPSGLPQLDQNALESAMHTIYAPAAKDCKPVVDHYSFKVTFDPSL